MAVADSDDQQRLTRVVVAEHARIRLSPQLENERRAAIYDLIAENTYVPATPGHGPYTLKLTIEGDRAVFAAEDCEGQPLAPVFIPIGKLKKTIKDYFLICDSYLSAIKTLTPSRIEAIDMGRRGLHDDGATELRRLLAGKVDIDHQTARRLFTLLVILHIRA